MGLQSLDRITLCVHKNTNVNDLPKLRKRIVQTQDCTVNFKNKYEIDQNVFF